LRHAESDTVAWLAEIDLALRLAGPEARQQLLDQRAQRTAARAALSEEIAAVTTQRVLAYLAWLARLYTLATAEVAQLETALAGVGTEQGERVRALQARRTRARQIAGLARHQAQWYGTDVRLEAPETWTAAAARAGRLQQVRLEETFPQDEPE
jgi:cell division inhibitor SulA